MSTNSVCSDDTTHTTDVEKPRQGKGSSREGNYLQTRALDNARRQEVSTVLCYHGKCFASDPLCSEALCDKGSRNAILYCTNLTGHSTTWNCGQRLSVAQLRKPDILFS